MGECCKLLQRVHPLNAFQAEICATSVTGIMIYSSFTADFTVSKNDIKNTGGGDLKASPPQLFGCVGAIAPIAPTGILLCHGVGAYATNNVMYTKNHISQDITTSYTQ